MDKTVLENTEKSKLQENTYFSNLKGISTAEARTKVSVREALTTNDANILMPKVIQQVVTEAATEQYLASQFFKKITLQEGRSMEFIHFGAIRAFEVGEGQEYPQQSLNLTKQGIGNVDVKIRKYGLQVSITDEMISDSQWDVIGLHLEAGGRALARLKEENMFYEFSKHGHVVFDADLFKAGDEGYPTGRGFDGNYNGTLSSDDIIDMSTSIMSAGYTPTDIIMHPLCWTLFAKNSALENVSHAAFGQGVDKRDPRDFELSNSLGLQVMFSPYVPFDQANKKFDFYILDRNNVGVIVVKDEISTDSFDDPMKDIKSLKIKERYGIGILNGGLGIAVARNIAFKRTFPAPAREFEKMEVPEDYKKPGSEKHDEI